MNVTVEKVSGSKVKLNFVLESAAFDQAIDQAFAKKVVDIEVKGFRKGKLPRDVYNTRFGEESLYEEAMNIAVNQAYQQALEEHTLDVVSSPELDVDFETLGRGKELKFNVTVEVWPEVTLGAYKGLEVVRESVEVTQKDIDAYVERAKKSHAELEIVEEGTLEKGQTAVFDFEGFVDGVAFDGGKAENYSLEIGSNQFIPGFEDQMIGMKLEEEKVIQVHFPEDYQAENLKGKPADFKIKLHEIKKRVFPELNDDFVKELNLEGVETVDQYLAYVKEVLSKEKQEASDNKFADDLLRQAIENATLEVPTALIEEEVDRYVHQMEHQAENYKIPLDQLLMYYGIESIDQYKETIQPTATMNVKQRAVFLKIAEVESLQPTTEDYEAEYAVIAQETNKKIEEAKKIYAKEMLDPYLKMRKVIDMIKQTAQVK